MAAGYSDGAVRVWDSGSGKLEATFHGHRKAVTVLKFNADGSQLLSGGRDTDLVVWDIVGEEGLCRLRGHKDAVTDALFLERGARNYVLSGSKDTLGKVWTLDTHHCVQTLVGHRGAIWSLDANEDESRIVTAGSDQELRVWMWQAAPDAEDPAELRCMGVLPRVSRARVVTVRFDRTGSGLLGAQCAGKMLEIFRVRDASEVAKKVKRRLKRRREKGKDLEPEPDAGDAAAGGGAESTDPRLVAASDEFEAACVLRTPVKMSSFAFCPTVRRQRKNLAGTELPLLLSLSDNTLELHTVAVNPGAEAGAPTVVATKKSSEVSAPGHRSDARAMCLSSDDNMLLSTSQSDIKVWNLRNQQCVRTIESGYGLCALFLPGDRQAVIGTKLGELEIFDIASARCVEKIKAHEGAVWSLAAKPAAGPGADVTSIATGSADHDVKFWDLEFQHDEGEGGAVTQRLTLECARTLSLSDDVLCIKFSPNGRLLAVALLDCTVKVFHEDSLKFFLNMYGHKLPVMALDMSFDNRLLVTASADKNIKIWGLDFGDCHKSMFAHSDSVMAVAFLPRTHYFFTAGKDKLVKYWDADKFERIHELSGHLGEVWCLCVSSGGGFLVSGSHDRSIRVWDQTEEQVFVEEEREKEMEEMFEKDIHQDTRAQGTTLDDAAIPTARTAQNMKAGERLAEALGYATAYDKDQELYAQSKAETSKRGEPNPPAPPRNPFLLGKTGSEHLLRTLRGTKTSEVEEALMVLPFTSALALFGYFEAWLKAGTEAELTSRCLFFLLRMYHNQIVATRGRGHVGRLSSLSQHARGQLTRSKDVIGTNMAALRALQREIEEDGTQLFQVARKVATARRKGAKKQRLEE